MCVWFQCLGTQRQSSQLCVPVCCSVFMYYNAVNTDIKIHLAICDDDEGDLDVIRVADFRVLSRGLVCFGFISFSINIKSLEECKIECDRVIND